jgi:hypothetical protein
MIAGNVFAALHHHLRGGTCQAFTAAAKEYCRFHLLGRKRVLETCGAVVNLASVDL